MDNPVSTKEDIITLLLAKKENVRALGAKRLGLFGSFVRNQQSPTSDIDMIVEFEQGRKNYDNFIKLAYFLEELLNRRIELVTYSSLSPYLKPHIQKEIEYIHLDA